MENQTSTIESVATFLATKQNEICDMAMITATKIIAYRIHNTFRPQDITLLIEDGNGGVVLLDVAFARTLGITEEFFSHLLQYMNMKTELRLAYLSIRDSGKNCNISEHTIDDGDVIELKEFSVIKNHDRILYDNVPRVDTFMFKSNLG